MDSKQFLLYLVVMAGTTYLVRALPFAAVRKKIKNRFIRSFLYYIPYTVLTVMIFPGALFATDYILSAAVGLVIAVAVAIASKNLTLTAASACVFVYITETVIKYI